jgi:hypothetical protein
VPRRRAAARVRGVVEVLDGIIRGVPPPREPSAAPGRTIRPPSAPCGVPGATCGVGRPGCPGPAPPTPGRDRRRSRSTRRQGPGGRRREACTPRSRRAPATTPR